MKIVNSTENYSFLTTNRLVAAKTNIGELIADSANLNNVTVTGLLKTGDFHANGNIYLNGPCIASDHVILRGGYGATSLTISSNYTLTDSDSGKHILLENISEGPIEIQLPSTSNMPPDGDLMYKLTVGPNVNYPINIIASVGDIIQGSIIEGSGTASNFNAAAEITLNPEIAVNGDTVTLRIHPNVRTTYVHGFTQHAKAFELKFEEAFEGYGEGFENDAGDAIE
jgi:hypothetical protein